MASISQKKKKTQKGKKSKKVDIEVKEKGTEKKLNADLRKKENVIWRILEKLSFR